MAEQLQRRMKMGKWIVKLMLNMIKLDPWSCNKLIQLCHKEREKRKDFSKLHDRDQQEKKDLSQKLKDLIDKIGSFKIFI